MTKRLKPHKAGARVILKEDDLLICVLMPPSLKVHTVRIIVSNQGHLEFAEWITGDRGAYSHKEKELTSHELGLLREALAMLANAGQSISFDEIDCDYSEYESSERVFLRFWFENKECGFFLPESTFFADYAIDEFAAKRFQDAFRQVISFLPQEWVTKRN